MPERQQGEKSSGRTRVRDEDSRKGSPAQTGPGSGAGMGTEEGSGFAPKGDRFGGKSTEGENEDEAKRGEKS
jgi:hypothetical protein